SPSPSALTRATKASNGREKPVSWAKALTARSDTSWAGAAAAARPTMAKAAGAMIARPVIVRMSASIRTSLIVEAARLVRCPTPAMASPLFRGPGETLARRRGELGQHAGQSPAIGIAQRRRTGGADRGGGVLAAPQRRLDQPLQDRQEAGPAAP